MNEQDLRRAFHDVMVASSPPPSMDPSAALRSGRQARSRRTAMWTGAVVMVLVTGVGLGTALVANGVSVPGLQFGSNGSSGGPTETNGRTQVNGPQADKGKELLNDLIALVPDGYRTDQMQYQDPSYNGSDMQTNQAQKGDDAWEYMVITPVQKDAGVGKLITEVHAAGNNLPAEPCALAQKFWGMSGECQVVDVAGKKVGLVTKNTSGRDETFDQWAAYRHPDGTVVFVGQGKGFYGSGRPALGSQVFTTEKLASLATDSRFHIS